MNFERNLIIKADDFFRAIMKETKIFILFVVKLNSNLEFLILILFLILINSYVFLCLLFCVKIL